MILARITLSRGFTSPPSCISDTSARSRIYFIVLLLRPAEKYSPYFHIFKHFHAPISIILFNPFHVSQILPPPPTIYSASRFHQPRMSNNCSRNVLVVIVAVITFFTNASPISVRRFRLRMYIYKTGKRFKRKWWASALIATQLTPLYPITDANAIYRSGSAVKYFRFRAISIFRYLFGSVTCRNRSILITKTMRLSSKLDRKQATIKVWSLHARI